MRKHGNTVSGSKGPKPPERPKMRSLAATAQHRRITPYLIEGEEKLGLLHEDNLWVALGKLKYRSYENYEIEHGESIDQTVSRIMWLLSETSRLATFAKDLTDKVDAKEITDEEFKTQVEATALIEKDEFGRTKTPYGLMFGSVERNMIDLAAYILAQYGRIVEDNGDGTYEYTPITPDDIKDRLEDPKVIFTVAEDGTCLFFEILELSGAWNATKVADDLASNSEVTDEELKN